MQVRAQGRFEGLTTYAIPQTTLDGILALQLTVAWAGEGLDARRLGWWRTDLIDEGAGGVLFARLMPHTKAWAGLEAALAAARQADAQARAAVAQPDRLRTLFHWGFHVDEHLADRLLALKHDGTVPRDVLPFPVDLAAPFDPGAFEAALRALAPKAAFEVVPSGRQMKGSMPDDSLDAARHLAAALVPLADRYPSPFFRV